MPEITRDELIALCEDALVPEDRWHDRDSADAQRQIGEAWALLRAGCQFSMRRPRRSTFQHAPAWTEPLAGTGTDGEVMPL